VISLIWAAPRKEALRMDKLTKIAFNTATYLTTPGLGRKVVKYKPSEILFHQRGVAGSIFYLQSGRAKLTVVSNRGKEATVTLLAAGEFVGEESIAGSGQHRTATASAVTACIALEIDRTEMLRVLREEPKLSEFFLKFMLTRGMKIQADLIDQLFNSSERRLARILLLMAEYGEPGEPVTLIPSITQETLADIIGTTRSRVSFFMNRFRKLGYIEYKGRIRVHKSLLNMVLQDNLPDENASRPKLPRLLPGRARTAE
jgi:CRP/FNR family cyclic AMP-dependent transcriptional regulator